MKTIDVLPLIFTRIVPAVAPVDVFDVVPTDAPFPYVQIGRSVARNVDFHDVERERILIYLSVFSAFPGLQEVSELIDKIKPVLHRYRGPLLDENDNPAGFVSFMQVRNSTVTPEPDGQTFTGQIALEVIVSQS